MMRTEQKICRNVHSVLIFLALNLGIEFMLLFGFFDLRNDSSEIFTFVEIVIVVATYFAASLIRIFPALGSFS